VAENARPPVAIRIVRPYETEEAFLENELETVGKTSVILIGAHSRPTGVILRFEVTLASGTSVLRGEGRVLAHKESAFRGQPGLALRFTRLDPKSKALVDRAAAIREARLGASGASPSTTIDVAAPISVRSVPPSVRPPPSAPPPPASIRPAQPDPVLAEALTAPTPEAPAVGRKGGRRSGAPNRSERPRSVTPRAPEASVAPPEPQPEPTPSRPPFPTATEEHDLAALTALVKEQEAEGAAPSATDLPVHTTEHAPPIEDVTAEPVPVPEPVPVEEAIEAAPAPVEEAIEAAPIPPEPEAASASVDAGADDATRTVAAPRDRDGLLARLRERAANLTQEKKAAILGS
jgi:hypothetical protein